MKISDNMVIRFYTDGSTHAFGGTEGPSGWGWVAIPSCNPDKVLREQGGSVKRASIGDMELMAFTSALDRVNLTSDKFQYEIYTDCGLIFKVLRHIKYGLALDPNSDVVSPALVQVLKDVLLAKDIVIDDHHSMLRVESANVGMIKFCHVRAHQHDNKAHRKLLNTCIHSAGNYAADKVAKKYSKLALEGKI